MLPFTRSTLHPLHCTRYARYSSGTSPLVPVVGGGNATLGSGLLRPASLASTRSGEGGRCNTLAGRGDVVRRARCGTSPSATASDTPATPAESALAGATAASSSALPSASTASSNTLIDTVGGAARVGCGCGVACASVGITSAGGARLLPPALLLPWPPPPAEAAGASLATAL